MRDLVLVGAGGFAREAAAAVRAVNEVRPTWRLLGYLDDNPALHGTHRSDLPILGPLATLHGGDDVDVVACVGNPRDWGARERVVDRLALPPERYATIVHPSAVVAPGCAVGPGSVLLAHAVLTADARVGAHVAVMPQVVITHDDDVADFVTIASGVRLGGGAQVHRGAYLGAGALVRESVTIGAGAQVGMGAVVLHDVPPGQIWVGNPARYLRDVKPHGS